MAAAADNAQTREVISVSRKDLPLACPPLGDKFWSQHPRVFLPVEKTGEATCPYCGARYQLRD
ncbi:MAG: zinc-finger domain-containing protein [Chromatiaceae bacterium]|nr:zinc-finger domain-containing protein [Chromatiaceae bacterium]